MHPVKKTIAGRMTGIKKPRSLFRDAGFCCLAVWSVFYKPAVPHAE